MGFVKYEPQGAVAVITIDREKALNALNSEVLEDLDKVIDGVDLETIRCLIIQVPVRNLLLPVRTSVK